MTSGAQYIYVCMCNVPNLKREYSKGVVADKIRGNFKIENQQGDSVRGFLFFIPAPTTNVRTSLKIPSLGHFCLKNDFYNIIVGVLSEMLREKYAGDMVNFSYNSPLDVRVFYISLH